MADPEWGYCYVCQNRWNRDQHRELECPDCHSDFVEVVSLPSDFMIPEPFLGMRNIYLHYEFVTDLLSRLNTARILERTLRKMMTAKTTQIGVGVLAPGSLVATSGMMPLIRMKVTYRTSLGHVSASLALFIDPRRLAWVLRDSM